MVSGDLEMVMPVAPRCVLSLRVHGPSIYFGLLKVVPTQVLLGQSVYYLGTWTILAARAD